MHIAVLGWIGAPDALDEPRLKSFSFLSSAFPIVSHVNLFDQLCTSRFTLEKSVWFQERVKLKTGLLQPELVNIPNYLTDKFLRINSCIIRRNGIL